MQENGKDNQHSDVVPFVAQTSRQRAIASNNFAKAAKEKAKKSLLADAPAKKRKTNNSAVLTPGWDINGDAIIEESEVPLSSLYSSDIGGAVDASQVDSVLFNIKESKEEWIPAPPKPPKAIVSAPKKKAEVPVVHRDKQCDCCGVALVGDYWYFYRKLRLLAHGTQVDQRQKQEGLDVQDALILYTTEKARVEGKDLITIEARKGRKLVRVGGSTCHQCHLRQPKWVTCPCGRRFCSKCLSKYADTVENAHEKDIAWECPFCAGLCNCAACRRDKQAAGEFLPPNTRFIFELCNSCAYDWSNNDTIVAEHTDVTKRNAMKFMEEVGPGKVYLIGF
jgi:hypothetical protein